MAADGLSPVERHNRLEELFGTPPGLGRLSAVNHSVVGLRFIYTSGVLFLIGGLLAMLIRAQLATADNAFLGHEAYNQVFTAHGTIMMFLFAIPMIEGITLYLLPKVLGARDLAFPRLSAFGYWCYLFGSLLIVGALIAGVGPKSGWFMYTPLASQPFTPGIHSDVWLLGITLVEISAIAIGVEICVTVLKVRAAGMALHRMPLFAWYIFVVALMILLGFPPLVIGAMLMELERAFGLPFFDPARGGDPLLWQHLFWLFGHPEVYIIFLPGAALVSTIIPTLARHPIVGYTPVVVAVIATGFISFALWVHHMYMVGIPHLALVFFSAASLLVAIPTAVQFFAWIATLWAGRPALELPLLYLFGFLVIFVIGGLTGVMVALVPFDWQVHDTHFIVAHLHYVLVGGFVFPLIAGAYYWLPHLTGRMPSGRLGHLAFWTLFVGFNITFFVMHWTGLLGMPRRVYTYPAGLGWDWPNLVSSVGGFILAIGFALFLLDMLVQSRLGRPAEHDPWRAGTLEWAMPMPAPAYNFASLPKVRGRDPLWDEPDLARQVAAGEHLLAEPRHGWRETLAVDAMTGRADYIVLLAGPTFVPLYAGLATAAAFFAFLFQAYWLSAATAVVAVGLYFRWAWLNGLRADPEPVPAGAGGPPLALHPAAPWSLGWWGTVFTIVANGGFLASLLFAFVYLRTVVAHAPEPPALAVSWPAPALAVAAPALAFLAMRLAARANAAGAAALRLLWLLAAVPAGLVGGLAFLAIPSLGLQSLTEDAVSAGIFVLCAYGALQAFAGSLIAGHAALRCMTGYVSAARRVDLQVAHLWWGYTAAASLLLVIALVAFIPIGAP